MAGDWVKMRVGLRTDPKVRWMANYLAHQREFMSWLTDPVRATCKESAFEHVTPDVVTAVTISALLVTWGVTREHGRRNGDDLEMDCCNADIVTDICGIPCFGQAMLQAGWLVENEDRTVATFPKFFTEREPPSERLAASNAERQRKYRQKKRNESNESNVTRNVTCHVTRNVTVTSRNVTCHGREEKRREEYINNTHRACEADSELLPEDAGAAAFLAGPSEGFKRFTAAYPRKMAPAKSWREFQAVVIRLVSERGWTDGQSEDFLVDKAELYASLPSGLAPPPGQTEDFRPSPATWLANGCFDEPASEWMKPNTVRGSYHGNTHQRGVRERIAADRPRDDIDWDGMFPDPDPA